MPSKPKLKKHITDASLRELYRKEKNSHTKTRLLALIHLYEGKGTPEAAGIVGTSDRTVRRWLKKWNDGGYENLRPGFSGGPKPLLSPEQWKETVAHTKDRGMDIRDVMRHTAERYGVEYSYSGVWKQIRGKHRVPYGKPLKKNGRRPPDAELILKKNMSEAEERAGGKLTHGFLDESAVAHDPAKRRVLNTRETVYTLSSEKRCVKLFGFAAPGCEDVITASDSCKKEDMIRFLREIREKNPEKPIGIILDNARIHTAEAVKEAALQLKLWLIPMPKYSPDLNPIEHLWKDTKRETAKYLNFDDVIPKIPDIALGIVKERKMSYSKKWRDTFITDKS